MTSCVCHDPGSICFSVDALPEENSTLTAAGKVERAVLEPATNGILNGGSQSGAYSRYILRQNVVRHFEDL